MRNTPKRIGIIDFYHEPCRSTQQPFLRRNTACFGSQYGTFHHPKRPILQSVAHQVTMPKFTSHFSYSFTAIVYILEHPLLNDFTALEKCP